MNKFLHPPIQALKQAARKIIGLESMHYAKPGISAGVELETERAVRWLERL